MDTHTATSAGFQRCYHIEKRDGHTRVHVSRDLPLFVRKHLARLSMWGGVDYAGEHALGFDVQEHKQAEALDWMSAVGYTRIPKSKVPTFIMEQL